MIETPGRSPEYFPPGGGVSLGELSDVDVTGVTDGQALVYDAGSELWVPETISSGGLEFNVLDYGAVGDGKLLETCTVTSGSTTFTSAEANFTAGDVGKTIAYYVPLDFSTFNSASTTIASVTNSTTVVLSNAASFSSSAVRAVYGTDDSTAFAAAFTAASNHFEASNESNPNIPMGGGQPIVYVPIGDDFGNYVLGSTLSIPSGCGIDCYGVLYNAKTARTSTDTFITTSDFPYIDKLYVQSMWGGGVNIGSTNASGEQTHSYINNIEIWNIVGNGLTLTGYHHTVNRAFIKQANSGSGIYHKRGSDCTVLYTELVGCRTGVTFENSNQVRYPAMFLDTCGSSTGHPGVLFKSTTTGYNSNISINLQAFTITGVTSILSSVVEFEGTNTNKHANITIYGQANNTGGALITANLLQECSVYFNGSNYVTDIDDTAPITTGVVYGTGLAGFNPIHLNLSAGITPYTGTLYHGFSYYQSSILYRAGEKIAEDNTVGSENFRLRTQTPLRFYDADNSNYVSFRSPSSVSSNVLWTLPSADGTSGQVLTTNGSGTLSWSSVSGTPGGSNTQLQYNNAGAFGGISGATSNGTTVTLTSPTIATSQNNSYATASTVAIFDGSKNLISADTATYPSLTELSYVKGVTSSIQTQINALANGMIYKGNWDASAGTFPGGGVAQTGWFYTVSVAGTVDGVSFEIGDRLIATTNNASTTTYAGNWTKLDATDAVTSVFGRVGNVVATSGDYTASQITNVPAGSISATTVQAALNELDTEKQATGNYITALTGDATASGPGSAALTFATVNSNVGSFTNATITVNAKGLITAASSGTAPVTSVTGTTDRITVTGTTTPTIDIASTYVGQTSITTLGLVSAGTWQAGSILAGAIATTSTSNAQVLGSSNTAFRVSGSGLTQTVTANHSYTNWLGRQDTLTEASSGTHPIIAGMIQRAPIINNGSATTTNAVTVYIEGAPTGTASPTNVYAVWIDDGVVRLDGNLLLDNLTASRAVVTDSSKNLASSSVTSTELGYMSGVTSAVQTQIDGKQATLISGTNIKTVGGNSLLGAGDVGTIGVAYGGTGVTSISALSVWVANSANTITQVTPSAGQSIRINAGGTAWEAYTPSGGGGTPGGSDTQVQFNDGGSFGGDAKFVFNKTTGRTTIENTALSSFSDNHFQFGSSGSVFTNGSGSTRSGISYFKASATYDGANRFTASPVVESSATYNGTDTSSSIYSGRFYAETLTSGGNMIGLTGNALASHSSGTVSNLDGLSFIVSNTANGGTVSNMSGSTMSAFTSGTVTTAKGGVFSITSSGGGTTHTTGEFTHTHNSGTITNVNGISNVLSVGGTVTTVTANNVSYTNTGAVGDIYMYKVSDITATSGSANNIYGFYSGDITGLGATAYNIYLSDTGALNYLGGNTEIVGSLTLGSNSITMTGSIASTGSRVTKGWFTDIESTNAPTVSGSAVYYTGGTDVALADGGTGASLSDPNADRIMFWDDSAGQVTWLEAGSGLSITGTTLTATGGVPTQITVANEASDTTCFVGFFTAATGDLGPKTNAGLTFNSSTGMLTATGFTGPLTGNASTATALQNARTIGGVSFDGTANITVATATGGFTVSGGDLALGTNSITTTGSIGTTGSRLTKGWFTDLEVTNAIAGSITGNAATVTVANEASDTTCFINFTTATSGSLAPKTNTNMTFNSSTGVATFASTVLTTTDINGGTIDGAVIGGSSAAAITGTTVTATTLVVGGDIQMDGTPNTDDTFSGPSTNSFNAGATIAQWEAVYLDSSSTWQLTDADSVATAESMIALATAAGTAGNPLRVTLPGTFVRNDAWTWTSNGIIYLSTTAGALTQTKPSGTDDVVRICGFAVNADTIFWYPAPGNATIV